LSWFVGSASERFRAPGVAAWHAPVFGTVALATQRRPLILREILTRFRLQNSNQMRRVFGMEFSVFLIDKGRF
jgi:hypothetical protein